MRICALLLFGCVLVCVAMIRAQSPPQEPPTAIPGQLPMPGEQRPDQEDETVRRAEKEQQKKANTDRYDKLKHDTDQLLQLATELKRSVDKSNEHTLSLDVIKKAGEIEKLAKSVKDRMKG